jgi:hypothetical protein
MCARTWASDRDITILYNIYLLYNVLLSRLFRAPRPFLHFPGLHLVPPRAEELCPVGAIGVGGNAFSQGSTPG